MDKLNHFFSFFVNKIHLVRKSNLLNIKIPQNWISPRQTKKYRGLVEFF